MKINMQSQNEIEIHVNAWIDFFDLRTFLFN